MGSSDFIFKAISSLKISESDLLCFTRECVIKNVSNASFFIMPGDESKYLPFVISGKFKVYKSAENGREITLYRIEDGQSCILSALSIINCTDFPATVEAEANSEVLLIPAKLLLYLVDTYRGWRNYIFSMYNDRFTDDQLLTNLNIFNLKPFPFEMTISGGGAIGTEIA